MLQNRLFLILIFLYCFSFSCGQNSTYFSFSNFTQNTNNFFQLISAAITSDNTLELCTSVSGQVWYIQPLLVRGFRTRFRFLLSNGEGNGFAFVIQNINARIIGPGDEGLGYGDYLSDGTAGIRNSVAIEFDSFKNDNLGDPNGNHISVHSRGSQPNSAYETANVGYTTLVPILNSTILETKIEYIPNVSLNISMTGFSDVILSIPFFLLEEYISINQDIGTAFVGFTASHSQDVQKQEILDWDFTFLGTISAGNTFASGSGLQGGIAGEVFSFNVQGVDQFGNKMTFGGALFNVTLSSEPNVVFNFTDNHNGTYFFQYIPTKKVQNALLSITLNSQPIKGSPFSISVSPAAVYPPFCIAFEQSNQNGLHNGFAGDTKSFTIQLYDRFNNTLDTQALGVNILVSLVGPLTSTGSVTYLSNGQYQVSYSLSRSGAYSIDISIDKTPILNPRFSISISPSAVYGPRCTTTDANKGGIAGTVITFFIQMVDIYGNIITSRPSPDPAIAISLSGASSLTGSSTYMSNGQYAGTFTAYIAGTYSMTVKVANQEVQGSPYRNILIASPNTVSPSRCIAYGSDLSGKVAGEIGSFLVQTVDPFGNNCTINNQALVWSVIFRDTNNNVVSSFFNATYQTTGRYVISYNITKSGSFSLWVYINNTLIVGNPWNNTINASSTYAPMCDVLNLISLVYTDEQHWFGLVSKDRYGNLRPIGGDDWNILIKDTVENRVVMYPTKIDNLDGTYNLTYQIDTSGEYELTVQLNALDAKGTPFAITCKWAGLGTGVIILIGGGIVLCLSVSILAFWIYRKKFRKRREYEPLRERYSTS